MMQRIGQATAKRSSEERLVVHRGVLDDRPCEAARTIPDPSGWGRELLGEEEKLQAAQEHRGLALAIGQLCVAGLRHQIVEVLLLGRDEDWRGPGVQEMADSTSSDGTQQAASSTGRCYHLPQGEFSG